MRHVGTIAKLTLVLLATAWAGCGGKMENVDFTGEDAREDAGGIGQDGSDGTNPGDTDSGSEPGLDSGADADLDPPIACPPPMDPTKAALCLVIEPEAIAFVAEDEKLDGNGMLFVQVFDKAVPGNAAALDEKLSPPQPSEGPAATKDLADLTAAPIRFDNLPTTVYPRALFVDDVAGAQPDVLLPGTWLGGIDFSNGLVENPPLGKVSLEAGKGTTVKMSLTALRRLTVQVSRAATPAGNAQGPLTILALGAQQLDQNAKAFGLGESDCADVSGSKTATVEGVVVGKGPYWVAGILDDFKEGSWMGTDIPSGALASLEFGGGAAVKVPDKNKLTYAPEDYAVSATIQLNLAIPRQGGGADAVSCP